MGRAGQGPWDRTGAMGHDRAWATSEAKARRQRRYTCRDMIKCGSQVKTGIRSTDMNSDTK